MNLLIYFDQDRFYQREVESIDDLPEFEKKQFDNGVIEIFKISQSGEFCYLESLDPISWRLLERAE